jgi:hypothetical protein
MRQNNGRGWTDRNRRVAEPTHVMVTRLDFRRIDNIAPGGPAEHMTVPILAACLSTSLSRVH